MSSPVAQLPSLGAAFGSLTIPELPDTEPQPPAPRQRTSVLAAPPSLDVDWPTVVVLRRTAAEKISDAAEDWLRERGTAMPADERRVRGRAIIRAVVHTHAERLREAGEALWSLELENRYAAAVDNAIFGFGRLQPLFEIPDAENIEIHGHDSVVIQYGDGRRVTHPPVADSDEELVDAIRFLGETSTPPRPFDDAHPTLTLALSDRFRLHAIGFGLSYRPSVIIRQHIFTEVSLQQLSDGGLMPAHVGQLLHQAVLGRKSIVISGDQGAGKTTLLRALIAAIPSNERFGTLETDYELLTHLQPGRENMLALQARVGLGETSGGKEVGSWSVADLIPEALRQNLSRLVVGEVRGTEAGAMFEAMQSGAGCLATTHAHSALSTVDRLASRVAQGGVLTIEEAMRQIAHNIHFLVHVSLDDQTWRGGTRRRYISEIRQLTGAIENSRPVTHLVYRAASAEQPEIFHPDAAMTEELSPFREPASWM